MPCIPDINCFVIHTLICISYAYVNKDITLMLVVFLIQLLQSQTVFQHNSEV